MNIRHCSEIGIKDQETFKNVLFSFIQFPYKASPFFPSFESVGIFFILPCTDSFVKVDLRTVSFDIPPQEVKNG